MTKELKAKPKKRKAASLDRKKARAGWIFVLPFVIGFILVYLPIVFDSIKYSFYEVKVAQTTLQTTFVGFENYQEAFVTNTQFGPTLLLGLQTLVLDIPVILIFSLFMAVLLNQKMAGRAAFRAIFFIPVIIATGIMDTGVSVMEQNMGSSEGINDGSGGSATSEIVSALDIEVLLGDMAVGGELVTFVVDTINNIYNVVNRSGVQMLIFLAGLQSISPAIYESVQIDGASAWETFWKITFPMITPMILVNAVYTIIDSFTASSNTVMTFIDSVYKDGGRELSSAMSWVYFLIIILIVAAISGIISLFVFYQKRD